MDTLAQDWSAGWQVDPFDPAAARHGVLTPGLPVLPPGVERHPVPGGGSRVVPLTAGDEIAIMDRQGLQPGEAVFFAADGRSDAGMLGAGGDRARPRPPQGVLSVLNGGSLSGARVLQQLAAVGIDPAAGDAIPLFQDGSRVGDMETFRAACDGLLLLAAPGGPMAPDRQDAPTDLVLYIRRSDPGPGKPDLQAPPPLADPLEDMNIRPGTATAYEVKAGQYIQVLDVKGRECSDFQAFSLRDLDRGLEREIDPTTTRSLIGALYPQPGLYAKYWNVDQQPLIEIVEDTCGRHDTFGIACSARYYEDLGYPGHLNCSENMNRELAPYRVRPRGGWPAINFFFNTALEAGNAISMNEPWSRPGDYVLLRALSDLVCVSSACPCDVDSANGWQPTDIQVRVYGAGEDFRRSVGYRKSAEADMEQTKQTGFHESFAAHTRDFVEYNGYWLANSMTGHGALDEYWACREKAVIMDLSPLRKYEITGPDAEELLQGCMTRNMKKLAVGRVVYSAMCYEHGGMIDDGTMFRLADTNFRWIGGNDTGGDWLRQQAAARGLNAWVRNSTDQLHNVAVQGRLSRDILADVFWTPPTQPTLEELGCFRFTIARVGDFDGLPVVISRTGYTGELGYEVFCHPDHAPRIFDAIWQAGAPKGLMPLGLAALDMLRIEAGLIFAGYEFCDRTDPFEAGIGFTVPLASSSDDFIGRAALERRAAAPQMKPVGLEITGGTVPANGDGLYIGKAQVGEVTSAVKSPLLGRVIALARLDVAHATPGTDIQVGQLDGQQKRLQAKVTTIPHFDPGKRRVKGHYDA